MKLFKSLILIISILICGLCFTGCESSNNSDGSSENPTTTSNSTEVDKTVSIDSVVSNHSNEINYIQKQIHTNGNELSLTTLLCEIGLAVAVLAFIIACVLVHMVNKLQARVDRHRQVLIALENNKSTMQVQSQSYQKSNQNSKAKDEYTELANRINLLELKLAQIQTPRVPAPVTLQQTQVKPATEQYGYFGVPSL